MRARILSLFCLLCASSLVLTSCVQIATPNPGSQNGAATYLYTATYTAAPGNILSIPAAYSGSITATTTTNAPTGGIFKQVTTDGAGKLYAVEYTGTPATTAPTSLAIYVYTIPNNGAGASTTGVLGTSRNYLVTLTTPIVSMAADPIGNVYISQQNGTLTQYGSTATGGSLATPALSLALSNSFVSMATDATADLFAASGTGMIYEFLGGFSSATPARTINVSATVTNITGIAVDSVNNIYVLGTPVGSTTPTVFVFALGTGTETPTRTIAGSNTTFNTPGAIAVDKGNNIYVSDFSTTAAGHQDFLEFASSANGNVAPVVVITNSASTTLTAGYGLVAY